MATKTGTAKTERKSKSGKVVVAAVDFGTTFSGYAFSFSHDYEGEPTKVSANTSWVAGSAGLMSLKTPTILLLDNNKKFVAFGYEAEEKYSEIAADEEHKKYYYFRRFKMLLHKVSGQLTRDVMIPDDKGRQMAALLVFSISIKYLKDHLMDTLGKRMTGILPGDIKWVLTVPAIWSDGSKQFMREAAEKAGIKKESLIIALEPEAASLFCMHLPVDKLSTGQECGTKSQQISPFAKGTRYMVVDVGGGTVDITIHEVVDDEKLKELNYASGGAWGGTCVDRAFEKFLRGILDIEQKNKKDEKTVFDKFMQEAKEDWVDLFREFETKKRGIKAKGAGDERSKETIKVPVRLAEIFRESTGKVLKDYIKTKKEYADKVTWAGDKMRVEAGIFRSWFNESCDNTVKHVKEIFKQKSSAGTNTILLVGGFSESPILQEAIRKNFPDKRLIIPEEAGLAVLRGAVIFGHNPVTIVSRIAKCSYGIRVYRDFQDGVHPSNKKVKIGGKIKCKDVFAVHVKKGQELIVGEAQSKQRYTPLEADQISLVFDIYTSTEEDPQYVTDVGSEHVGQLEVEVPDLSGGKERGVWVQMIFGGTEVTVEAREEKTNKLTKANFDFLLTNENASDSA
ncbi:heat shock 70 kDa protein 12A-like [Mercenaria mercenaria]|uniref:heat shock 70 kDa protein 12A-like n=1 Tax=Mercenaria mercenaria TaxID=6596 RepID=UPI001E1D6972|nr:heat shock 70 kDa protein 12A-like [Mercenaria mercenaria]XP_045205240.1 heat shock 70 kDa protein 12A-like [Mercenaria mercenaria]XP_045205241.1 heat shock 70 kDa protein 12A-like [Mercenaria mercenaria]XP_045205242.1 heat shock 70 kDa protein 12A-like [Mercenaria mercenaria]XP_045205243.1 heat shock 70 kDa protein 12A-like [Mercenaria mercenaria]